MSSDKDNNGKKRSDKYEEKVSFDGTFEDMVNMSFNNKKHMKKFKTGDLVRYNGSKKIYVIVSTNEDGTHYDYIIAEYVDGVAIGAPFQVMENDLTAA